MKKKICCVVQRYGLEINGGAEDYTRIYCEKLSTFYDVTAVATTALDYQNWENHYPAGMCEINGVKVYRFPVERPRDPEFAAKTISIVNNPYHTLQESLDWVESQGPYSPGLVEFIESNRENFQLFLFFTYLYYPTVMGLETVKEKAVLVPFCHDEPYIQLKCFNQLFTSPKALIFNTEEEREFVRNRFDNRMIPNILTGIGLDIPPLDTLPQARERFQLDRPYILYMGRIDESKGCHELFKYFLEYKMRTGNDLQLVLLGKPVMEIPKRRDIKSLGFLTAEEKYAVLREAELLVLPSHFESLSIVVLEAFQFKKPVLVSGHCQVLKGHCTKSNAGLYFYGAPDFHDCLDLLISNPPLREAMGNNGYKYVQERYQWEGILERLHTFLDQLADSIPLES